jgi:hypothetical protein
VLPYEDGRDESRPYIEIRDSPLTHALSLAGERDFVGMPFENLSANGMEILRCAQND